MVDKTVIDSFTFEYRFLSNFWMCPVAFEGITWRSAEHAYQAAKTDDPAERQTIQAALTPGRAKRLGRQLTLRSPHGYWEQVKIPIMKQIVWHKFLQNLDLAQRLCDTAPALLIEGNHWGDVEWGCVWNVHTKKWEGKNNLGKILMDVRRSLEACA